MSKFILIAFTVTLSAAASTAHAGGYASGPGWGCLNCGYKNGTELTGMALDVSVSAIGTTVGDEDDAAEASDDGLEHHEETLTRWRLM